ncbi:hypothetical protein CL619_04080 [archaeon]|nr:hypothetical protein [archaeon]|tara:strand:+ start:615 stop:1460 length:846 start_codon:yes stop_codon:yes gene_type:complete
MKTVKSFDGTKIAYYKRQGNKEKPTLVFLHGVGGNYTTWNKELEFFEKKKYPCIAVDLRGHGESDVPDEFEKYSTEAFAKDLDVILDKEKIESFVLIGHSLGGCIALTFHLLSKKSAEAITLIEPSIVYPFNHDQLLNHSSFTTKLLRKIAYNHKLRSEHFPHFQDIDLSLKGVTEYAHIIKHLLQITPIRSIIYSLDQNEKYMHEHFKDMKKFVKSFEHPLLVISSDDDDVCLPENAKAICQLNKKHATFYLLSHAGHKSIITHPKEVSFTIFSFLEHVK